MNGSPSSLSEQAASRIMDMILMEQRFQSGDKLPNEMELAQELGISRVTLREAIRILSTRGLVEIKRGKGTYVTAYQSAEPQTDLSALDTTVASHRDLLEIRMMVEPPACYYAAKRATAEEVETIKSLSLKLEEQAAQGLSPLKTEQDFHNAIALASHNQFMTQLMPIINKAIYTDVVYFKESIRYSIQDHREIVRYIESRNAEGARTVMQLHIFHTYQISNLRFE
jgi:DNA-binding FadR family transcriptional regulator